jgi:hypothetical protein
VSTLEIQTASEVGHVVARMGMSRKEANILVRQLVGRYENQVPEAPLGRKFSEIYDLEKVSPLPDYEAMYREVRTELEGLGLDYSLL